MARSGDGTRIPVLGKYSQSSAATFGTDLTELSDDIEELIGESEALVTDLPASGNWTGRTILVRADNTSRVWTGTQWIPIMGTYRATGTSGSVNAAMTSVAQVVVPAGTWKLEGFAYFDWSTSSPRKYIAQLYNLTATSDVLSGSIGPTTASSTGPVALSDVVTVAVPTTFQLRVGSSATDGTQLLATARLLVTQTTLRS
jgi:hypothetical protein